MRVRLGGLGALLTLILMAAPAAVPASASAQTADDAAAQAHFTVAASYYDQGNYADALREFENAYRLSHRAQLFYNFSLCYQQLGDLPHAVEYLERYLAEVADIPNRATLEVRLENLRARAAAASAGSGTGVSGDPDAGGSGAAGGASAGGGDGGASGGGSGAAGDTSGGAGASDGGGAGDGRAGGGASDGGASGGGPSPGGGGGGPNVGAIAGFSVAALGLVGVAAFGGATIAADGDLATGCGRTMSCTGAETSSLQTFALLTDISWGLALAGAVVGTVMLVVGSGDGGADRASRDLEVVPLAGPGTAGVAVAGRF